MIQDFADKETKKVFNQQFSSKLPQSIQKTAFRKLMIMEHAENINDLRMPPANHLEKLSGNRADQYSIKINRQYRICFSLINTNQFVDVEIVDYH